MAKRDRSLHRFALVVFEHSAEALLGTFGNYGNGAALGMHDGRAWHLWYRADAATGSLTGGNDVVIAAVPEPSVMVLLGIGMLGILGWERKRARRAD